MVVSAITARPATSVTMPSVPGTISSAIAMVAASTLATSGSLTNGARIS